MINLVYIWKDDRLDNLVQRQTDWLRKDDNYWWYSILDYLSIDYHSLDSCWILLAASTRICSDS